MSKLSKKFLEKINNRLIWHGIKRPAIRKGNKCIIMYHGIDLFENRSYNNRFFSKENFERHIIYFKKNYNIISLPDLFNNININQEKLNVAITFDDGYRNNFTYAYPILEKHQVYATFFVTGINRGDILWADLLDICTPKIKDEFVYFDGHKFQKDVSGKFNSLKFYIKSKKVSGTPLFQELKKELLEKSLVNLSEQEILDYWQLLNPEEIKLVSKSKFVKIGSHGFYHNNLGNLDVADSINELKRSKNYLEELTQYEVNSVGYPDGSYNIELAKEAFNLGFQFQCLVEYNQPEDRKFPFLMDRVGLYPNSTMYFINYLLQINSR